MIKQKLRFYVDNPVITLWIIAKRLAVACFVLLVGWVAYSIYVVKIVNGESFEQALSFIALWFLFAYVLIPRLHRILSKMYLPNYFIGRIKTADGLLSDPVNLAFIGSEEKLHKAMQDAGWTLADDLNLKSIAKMMYATVFRKSYIKSPVSRAYLFNELQSFTYQQEVNGKTNAKHHVRFWKVPSGWLMPGGYKVDWVAAATYDRAIGISFFTFQLTHRIDSDTDIERDYIVKTIKKMAKPKSVKIIKHYFSAYHHRNGGGDSITTDGSLPIIKL